VGDLVVRRNFHHINTFFKIWCAKAIFSFFIHHQRAAIENQLILTAMMLEHLPVELQRQCRLVGPIYVKGKQEPIAVHELLWNSDDSADATMVGPSKDLPVVKRRLLLRLGDQQCIVDERHPSASIGRSADSDLTTLGSLVSRHHLIIEQRGDKFIATDKSTNATFVGGPQDHDGQRLHRDKLILSGRGWLSLGQPHPEEDQKIRFEIM
jgi:hypothetical protein